MSEKTEVVVEEKEAIPVIGVGSPAGKRWFVSCKYPHLQVVIRPAQDKTSTSRAIKGVYAYFKTLAKPNSFLGDGKLGTNNPSGTDMNDSPYWGIYESFDPGPEPEEGYKDDVAPIPRKERRTAADKKLLRDTIDTMRGTDYYAKTQQNNEVDRFALLKELDWDPTSLSGTMQGYVAHGRNSLNKTTAKDARVPAPAEVRAAVPVPKVPSLSRRSVASPK